jgi:hypothetical protein
MTVKELREVLEDFPDDTEIVLWEEGNFVTDVLCWKEDGNFVLG